MIKIIIFAVLIIIQSRVAWATPDLGKIRVEFEWEEIVGSSKYEIELYDRDKKLVSNHHSPTSVFSVDLVPGFYYIRGRVFDKRTAYGEWSPFSDFLVPPKKIEKIEPQPENIQVDRSTFLGAVNLSWTHSAGTHHYKVTVFDENGKTVKVMDVQEANLKLNLKPGIYSYKIIPVTADNIEGEVFTSPQNIVIKSRPVPEVTDVSLGEESKERILKWKKETSLPTLLRLEHQKHLSDSWQQLEQQSVDASIWKMPKDLKPGKYRASFWHKSPLGDVSTIKIHEFVVKPLEKDLP